MFGLSLTLTHFQGQIEIFTTGGSSGAHTAIVNKRHPNHKNTKVSSSCLKSHRFVCVVTSRSIVAIGYINMYF